MLILPCHASQSFDLEPFALKSNRNPDILRNRKRRKERGSWWASSVGLSQSLLSFGYDWQLDSAFQLQALPAIHSSEQRSRNKEGPEPQGFDTGHLSNQACLQPSGLNQPAAHGFLLPEISQWPSVVNTASQVGQRPWGESFSFRMLSKEKPLLYNCHLFRRAHWPGLHTACLFLVATCCCRY